MPDDARIEHVVKNMKRMLNFRRPYDSQRAYFYRQYLLQRDGQMYPDGVTPRANTPSPYPRNNVETVVSRTVDAFFSIDPPFETRGRSERDEANSPAMQTVQLHMLKKANWRQKLEILTRNICIYGFAGIKVDWDWCYDTVVAPEPVYAMQPQIDQMTGMPLLNPDGQPSLMPFLDPMSGEPVRLGTQLTTKQIPRNRPKLTPIDIFDLLVDPDGGQCAMLLEKPYYELLKEAQMNPGMYEEEGLVQLEAKLKDEPDKNEVLVRLAEYWDETENTVTLITFGDDGEAISRKDERYANRGAQYSAYKRKVYAGESIKLKEGDNPFIHRRMPILWTSYTKLTGEPFGVGVIEPISQMSDSLATFGNMITDNWNLGINRRFAYDTNASIDHDALNNLNVPGGKVGVDGDPSAILFPLPIMTPSSSEFAILELYKQQIEISSGISDFYSKGIGSSGGNRTATGIGQVISEANYIFRMFIRNLEIDILQPMLEMTASMIQQYCSDYVEYQITDAAPGIPKVGRIPLENLVGNYDFEFVGPNYVANPVIQQRNMMALYNMASQTPYARQGEFLRETAKTLRIPNARRLIKSDAEVMQEQQAGIQQSTQMMLLEKLLDTESKAVVAELGKKEPNKVTSHGLAVQEIIEEMLEEAGQLASGAPPTGNPKEGRPATAQFEGEIPGGGATSGARGLAQSNGANALGLGGIFEGGR